MQLSLLNVLLKIPLSETFLFEEDLFPNASEEEIEIRNRKVEELRLARLNSFRVGDRVSYQGGPQERYGQEGHIEEIIASNDGDVRFIVKFDNGDGRDIHPDLVDKVVS
jgi:hypothetical protein